MCLLLLIHYITTSDAPPSSLMDLIASPKVTTTEGKRSWGAHFGGRGACWSFEMGTRNIGQQINYSQGLTQTKQQLVSA
jgi:hypothetical protein